MQLFGMSLPLHSETKLNNQHISTIMKEYVEVFLNDIKQIQMIPGINFKILEFKSIHT